MGTQSRSFLTKVHAVYLAVLEGPLLNGWSEDWYSIAFHPQTDRQTERSNSALEQYLRLYVSFQQDDWVKLLPLAEFAYNNSKRLAIGMSPFMVLEGWEQRFMLEIPGAWNRQ